MTVNRRTHRPP